MYIVLCCTEAVMRWAQQHHLKSSVLGDVSWFYSNTLCSVCDVLCCVRPNTGVSSFDEEKSDLLQKYRKISREDAGRSPYLCVCLWPRSPYLCVCLWPRSPYLCLCVYACVLTWWMQLLTCVLSSVTSSAWSLTVKFMFVRLVVVTLQMSVCVCILIF